MASASSFAALKAYRDARRNPFAAPTAAGSDDLLAPSTSTSAGDMGPPPPPTAQAQPRALPIPLSRSTTSNLSTMASPKIPSGIGQQRPSVDYQPQASNHRPQAGAAGSRVRLPDIQDLELRFDAYSNERALFYAPLPKNGPKPADFSTSTSSSSAFSPTGAPAGAQASRSLSGSMSYSYSQLLSSSYSAPGGWAAAGISACRPGDVLLRVRPEVAVLSTALLEQRCSACYSPPATQPVGTKLQRCSACKVVRYCSAGCQKRDWPAHRDECKALKAMQKLNTYTSALRDQRRLDQRLAGRFAQRQRGGSSAPFSIGSFQDNDEVVAAAAVAGQLEQEGSDEEDAGENEHVHGNNHVKKDTTTKQNRIRLPSSMMRALARWIWARSRVAGGSKDKARGQGGDLLEFCSHRERFAPEQLQQQAQLALHLAQYLTAAARATATFGPVSSGEDNLDEMLQPESTFSQGDALRALGIDSATELLDLVCQFSCNCFTLTDSDLNPLGVCMHPSMAMINHACTPNVAVVFPFGGAAKHGQQKWNDGEDKIMQLVALRAIEPGEELLITYVDVAETYQERRSYLKKRYCFDCRCDLCRKSYAKLAPATAPSLASSASSSSQGFGIRSPQTSSWIDPRCAVWCPLRCGGWIDGSALESQGDAGADSSDASQPGVAKCNKCQSVSRVSSSDVAEDTQQAKDALKQASRLLEQGDAEAAWTRCASVLPVLVERYPPSWQTLFQLLRLATTCLIEVGSFLLSLEPSEASNDEVAVYCFDEAVRMQMMVVAGTQASSAPIYPKGHPARAIAIATLAKLTLAQFDHAQRLGERASAGTWQERTMQCSAETSAPVLRAAVEQMAAQGGKTLSILKDAPSVPEEMRIELIKQLLTQSIEELDIGFGRSNQGGRTGREMRTALNEIEQEIALLAQQTRSLSVSE
ncbi:uncharacterized protein MEPE_03958 [Melanopsichium pennsylvanicum]|uniref:SET domain-containing protein n=2 Tax=Melanopsichium pennsylvanicum TaxID=63383 RepID=A0AAJ4XMU4_9BASI|nr:set domain-containing protein [Melanopsichium pennsylvanicum 4]SNX85249.1 uncharacterized protein MEPE_03958 [Melanopsichium pennsylvanicum]